jgi:hypothetical protein
MNESGALKTPLACRAWQAAGIIGLLNQHGWTISRQDIDDVLSLAG